MMKLLASLCLFTACAHQAPAPAPIVPQPVACQPGGAILFEIDTNDLAAGPEKNIVYANGAWAINNSATGCVAAADLATIQNDIQVPWTTSARTGIRCHMEHAPTNYIANGKTVYVDSGCSSGVLDDASAKALGEIVGAMKKAEKQ
jgi:hypothetical protein